MDTWAALAWTVTLVALALAALVVWVHCWTLIQQARVREQDCRKRAEVADALVRSVGGPEAQRNLAQAVTQIYTPR